MKVEHIKTSDLESQRVTDPHTGMMIDVASLLHPHSCGSTLRSDKAESEETISRLRK